VGRVLLRRAGSLVSRVWDAAQPLLQRYTLKPGQDTFDHLFSLWLPYAARIALVVIRRYVGESKAFASFYTVVGWTSLKSFSLDTLIERNKAELASG
jgi:hypothetical protein